MDHGALSWIRNEIKKPSGRFFKKKTCGCGAIRDENEIFSTAAPARAWF
jgi:hypothetical protein